MMWWLSSVVLASKMTGGFMGMAGTARIIDCERYRRREPCHVFGEQLQLLQSDESRLFSLSVASRRRPWRLSFSCQTDLCLLHW